MGLSLTFCGLAAAGCAGGDGGKSERTPVTLPDYENMESEPLIINGWVSPPPTLEAYREYKEAGFNYIFIMGQNAGAVGSKKMDDALDVCDELGIKVFVDISRNLTAIDATIEKYSKHPSFAGYNYDEPVIYRNTINNSEGLEEIGEKVKTIHANYPTVEFLVNLNPSECVDLNWGTPKFTYAEYLEAQTTYINSIYADSSVHNWLSCDSYPICNNQTSKHPYYLKTSWLQNLAYLAEIKRDSDVKLTTNFFIQSMPYVHAPSWLKSFFLKNDNDDMLQANSRVILLKKKVFENEERVFALTFGYARFLFKANVLEEQFGLRIVLNTIQQNEIRKISKTSVGTNQKQSNEQLPKNSDISEFGFDINRDLMKNVSGKSEDEMFEKSMLTGGDIFSLTVGRDISNIDEFLEYCYHRYKDTTYQDKFAWIDNIKYVRDKSIIEQLDTKLIEEINNKNYTQVWMAVPEVVEWEDIKDFLISNDSN